MFDPVDSGVCGSEPGESENDILSAITHDIEEMFLGNPFDVCVEDISVVDHIHFVSSLVYIANSNGGGEFFHGEAVFSEKLPVNARDISTGVYQCGGVDDFEGVRGGDQLYRNTHRFDQSGYKYRSAHY